MRSPKCNLLYEPETIKARRTSPLMEVQDADQDTRDPPSEFVPDFQISQLRSRIDVLEDQEGPKATKAHKRQGDMETENEQYRQNARQREVNDLEYFKRVHLLPARNKRVKMAHWIASALTQDRSATPFNVHRR